MIGYKTAASAACLAFVATFGAASVSAQGMDYYIGGGYESSSAVSTATVRSGTYSDGALSSLVLVGGMEMDRGAYFLGGEINVGMNIGGTLTPRTRIVGGGPPPPILGTGVCGRFAWGPYACSVDYTARARAIVGVNVGNVGLFGTAGAAMISGTFATSPLRTEAATVSGTTYGVGARYTLSNGMMLRGEVIWDNLTNSTQTGRNDSDWTATSVQLTLIKRF